MSQLVWPLKAPAEILDYDIDWTLRLAGDTIIASQWTIVTTDGVLAVASSSFTSSRTKVFLSAGTSNFNYVVQNTITTQNGDTEIETVSLPVRNKA